jgi:hypothetical protein
MKQPLALTYPQVHLLGLPEVMGHEFSIPEILGIPEATGRFSQILVHGPNLLRGQTLRTAGSLLVLQAAEPSGLEVPNPSLNGGGVLPEHLTDLVAGEAPTDQQHAVQAMIVSCLLGAKDFVSQRKFHHLPIGNMKTFHGASLL